MKNLAIDIGMEEDGRVIAEVTSQPGVLVYGSTEEEARRKALALALRVLAEQLDNGEISGLGAWRIEITESAG